MSRNPTDRNASAPLNVDVRASAAELGQAAAAKAAEILTRAIATHGRARVLLATGNSQIELAARLMAADLAWDKVEAFHLDEYVGIPANHSASFRRWIKTRYADRAPFRSVEYLNGNAADPHEEARRYAQLLDAAPIDLAFVGFGENGHIAFNDPPVADFNDPLTVKQVELDQACRMQQVNEKHFPDLASVPRYALTVTCSALLRARHWVCSVPDLRKADAVRGALEGPLATACPASAVRTHPAAFIFLDRDSASRLTRPFPVAS
ncbi:MAG: glucosamine-6-phosphate deaminase [Opitutae bacterium]|jgi:glucosamine-6-phosphate deaminase|nr:glucosamine-6-phosphate deaminase [Opitutae bacterium]